MFNNIFKCLVKDFVSIKCFCLSCNISNVAEYILHVAGHILNVVQAFPNVTQHIFMFYNIFLMFRNTFS